MDKGDSFYFNKILLSKLPCCLILQSYHSCEPDKLSLITGCPYKQCVCSCSKYEGMYKLMSLKVARLDFLEGIPPKFER